MNLPRLARLLVAISFFLSGLAETLSATGLVIEFSPDTDWGGGFHTLALGGALQMASAALLASGRKTCWALGILLCYVFLSSVLGNLPQVFNPEVGGDAIGGLLRNMAVIGGLLYWLHGERSSGRSALPAKVLTESSPQQNRSLAYTSARETQLPSGHRQETTY